MDQTCCSPLFLPCYVSTSCCFPGRKHALLFCTMVETQKIRKIGDQSRLKRLLTICLQAFWLTALIAGPQKVKHYSAGIARLPATTDAQTANWCSTRCGTLHGLDAGVLRCAKLICTTRLAASLMSCFLIFSLLVNNRWSLFAWWPTPTKMASSCTAALLETN